MTRRNALLGLIIIFGGCRSSTHAVQPSTLGRASSSETMVALIDQPGPIELTTVNSADWEVELSGLVNLDSEAAKAAGLTNRAEPIHVYFHVIEHPRFGTWWVDSGVEHAVRDDPTHAAMQGLVASVMHTDKLRVQVAPSDWLAQHPNQLKGVFFTHLHLDHISGVPDLPADIALYSGPHEAGFDRFVHLFTQGTSNKQLEGKGPLNEFAFTVDPAARFEGVIDVFGDGSLWALWVPGHTPGSVAYLARTTKGPVLLTGDLCHTRWGWEHEVEPGSFTNDHPSNLAQLKRVRAFVAEHPSIDVRLGHQE